MKVKVLLIESKLDDCIDGIISWLVVKTKDGCIHESDDYASLKDAIDDILARGFKILTLKVKEIEIEDVTEEDIEELESYLEELEEFEIERWEEKKARENPHYYPDV